MTRKVQPPADAVWHGTWHGYTKHRCGCGPCTAANAAGVRNWSRRAKPLPPDLDPDSLTAYKYYNSRTPGALRANADRKAAQKARHKARRLE